MKLLPCLFLFTAFFISAAMPAHAQEINPVPAASAASPLPAPAIAAEENVSPEARNAFAQSLMFSPAEIVMIQKALAVTTTGAAAPGAGIGATTNVNTIPIIPPRRIIAIAGVIWRSDKDWIVWINGKKVSPDNLLPEIVDIKVGKEKIDLEWFDIGINDVISITLRAHQTYDIVTGVLLPG